MFVKVRQMNAYFHR